MINDYQKEVDEQFKREKWDYWPPLSMFARLAEEVGEVARELMHCLVARKRNHLKQDKILVKSWPM